MTGVGRKWSAATVPIGVSTGPTICVRLSGRIIDEPERFVTPVPLVDEIVFLASVRRRRRWE
ncbi:hypothetical protein BV210_18205 (plasmid) [Halorientalis sp. IM1011]|nr:hypothetical protein BV210_18205 [Halorientalis sp. IM1011]